MTSSTNIIPTKTVGINITSRGISYAVMHSPVELQEVNMFAPKTFDSQRIIELAQEIVERHAPITLILEDTNNKYCRKGARSKQIMRVVALWAKKKGIHIEYISREQVRNVFKRWGGRNKFEVSDVLIRNVDKLKPYQYDKPKYPNREPNNATIFVPVSICVTYYFL